VAAAVPPPLPGTSAKSAASPPPVPILQAAPAKKSFPVWVIVVLAVIALGFTGGMLAYLLRQSSFPPGYRNRPTAGWGARMGENEFDAANERIDSFQGNNAFGNSPEAVEVARIFSHALKAARQEMFTSGIKLEVLDHTEGEFMTYCELHGQECAIIVHVPQLRKFKKDFTEKVDARKLLAQMAWMTAQKTLKQLNAGKPGMELAVGLRGISQYGPIMIGNYKENATQLEDGLVKYLDDGTQTQFLWTFFAPEDQPRPK
jgi:hypothetical protein